MQAITVVSHGEAIFSPSIARRLTHYFPTLVNASLPQALSELTQREREILTFIAQGRNNVEIATLSTLATFREEIYGVGPPWQVISTFHVSPGSSVSGQSRVRQLP